MVVETSEQSNDLDTRSRILDAAMERFSTFGFCKTTMAELANDTKMSAANLYRYFENKNDIAAACAQRCMANQACMLREVVRQSGISAAQKLEDFVLEMLRSTHESYQTTPRINELVDIIIHDRPDIVFEKIRSQKAMVSEILAQGNSSGEFDVEDVVEMADTVLAMTKMFHVPIFMGLHDIERLEKLARDAVALMVKGLAKR